MNINDLGIRLELLKHCLGDIMTSKNLNLNRARKSKNDEFYTKMCTIEEELQWYCFKDKVVYCNCDDFRESNFYKYFKDNFKKLGIKSLYATNFDIGAGSFMVYFDGVEEYVEEVADGSFSSEGSLRILELCNVVVTNPPFSLFRDYYNFIKGSGKDFLILANMNMISYVPLFRDIKNNTTKFGINQRGVKFDTPEGEKSLGNVCWLTSLNVPKKTFHRLSNKSVEDFDTFDGTDVINVNRWKDFPDKYFGLAGVPISALPKINRDQFNVIGYCNNKIKFGVDFHSLVEGKSVYLRVIVQRTI